MKWLINFFKAAASLVLSCLVIGAGFSIIMFGSAVLTALLFLAGVVILIAVVAMGIKEVFDEDNS